MWRPQRGDLKAEEDEHDPIQQEDEHLPHGAAGEPDVGAHDARGPPPEVQTGRDRREHTGGAEQFSWQIGGVWGQERHRDLDGQVGEQRSHVRDEPSDRKTDRDPSGADDDESPDRRERQGWCRRTATLSATR